MGQWATRVGEDTTMREVANFILDDMIVDAHMRTSRMIVKSSQERPYDLSLMQ